VSIHKQCTMKSAWPAVVSPPQSATARVKTPDHNSVVATASRTGRPLEPSMRTEFTSRLATDFSDVRIHADAEAAKSAAGLGASAYTVGRSIVFGQDQYAPGTAAGRDLIAHELAHVAQQQSAVGEATAVAPPTGDLERDAERSAAARRPPSLRAHARYVQMQQAPAGVLGKEMTDEDQRAIDRYLSDHKFKVFLGGATEMDGTAIAPEELVGLLQQQVVPGRDLRAVKFYVDRKIKQRQAFAPLPPARPHEKTLGQTIEGELTKPRPTPTGPPVDVQSPAPQTGDYSKVMQGGKTPFGSTASGPQVPIPESKPHAAESSSTLTGIRTASYSPGSAITFTVSGSKDFWSTPGRKQVVLLEAGAPTGRPLIAQDLQPSEPTTVRWQAPSKGGRYVIQVQAGGIAVDSRGTSELIVFEPAGPTR
jgi:hypothetical protein